MVLRSGGLNYCVVFSTDEIVFSIEQDYCTNANHYFSHSLMVLSTLPLASVCPSGLMATLATELLCPVRVRRRSPVFRFHSLMVLSSLPLASICPSGLMATLSTWSSCPVRVRRRSP